MKRALLYALLVSAIPCVVAPQTPFLNAPRFKLERDLVIDGAQEDWVPIGTMWVAPDGRMAISQLQDYRVIVYDASGKRRFSFGRKGAGPGEFERLWIYAGWTGDTLWIYDDLHRRITLVGPTGLLAREITIPSVVTPASAFSPASSTNVFMPNRRA